MQLLLTKELFKVHFTHWLWYIMYTKNEVILFLWSFRIYWINVINIYNNDSLAHKNCYYFRIRWIYFMSRRTKAKILSCCFLIDHNKRKILSVRYFSKIWLGMFSHLILLLKFYENYMESDRYLEHLQNNPRWKSINHYPSKAFPKHNNFHINHIIITLYIDCKDHLKSLWSICIP